jgi:hypothetical protein
VQAEAQRSQAQAQVEVECCFINSELYQYQKTSSSSEVTFSLAKLEDTRPRLTDEMNGFSPTLPLDE